MTFDERYFEKHYSAHDRNTPKKLCWYLDTALSWVDATPIRHLDVGCGLGDFVAFTSKSPRFLTHGTDVSDHAIAIAKQKTSGADLRTASADAQPWPPKSFDLITILDVLEHVPHPDMVIRAAETMLDDDGIFMAVLPVYDGASGPVIKLLDHDVTHIHRWDRSAWIDLISEHFELLDWMGVFRYGIPAGPYLHFPTRLLRKHSPAILIVGRKIKSPSL